MAYSVPMTSSPPMTPEAKSGLKGRTSYAARSGQTTTPAGLPPPSSAASFTPAGSPPSTLLGSSQLGSQNSLFSSRPNGKPARSSPLSANPTASASQGLSKSKNFSAANSGSGMFGVTNPSKLSSFIMNDGSQAEKRSHNDDNLDLTLSLHNSSMDTAAGESDRHRKTTDSNAESMYDWAQHGSSTRTLRNPKLRRGPKSSRGISDRPPHSYSVLYSTRNSRKKQKSLILDTLCKSAAAQLGPADLCEPHSLILETEKEIRRIYPEGNHLQDQDELLEAALRTVPDTLARAWQKCCKEEHIEADMDGSPDIQVGPRDGLPLYHKASFIGNLLLKLYHPPPARGKQAIPSLRASRHALVRVDEVHREEAYPRLLMNWLNDNHNPYAEIMQTLGSYLPNATAHPSFWDMLLTFTLRGLLGNVVRLLNQADFAVASSADEDGFGREGYPAHVLNTIEREVQRVVKTLNLCPAMTDDDWNVVNGAWSDFRMKVESALDQLIATSERVGTEPTQSAFDASKLTLRSSLSEFSKSTKQTEVKMPRTVFRNLRQLYNILLGRTNELLAASTDWVEATIALTAWWDGEDDEGGIYSFSISKQSRMVDADPGAAYRKRLAEAFERASGDGDGLTDTWQIDSNSPVDIALGSVFENNLAGVFELLKTFSLPISSAIVEIGTQARWYRPEAIEETATELDQSDMMVLGYAQPERLASKNDILTLYADRLSEIPTLEWQGTRKEGWELAIEILSRMDNLSIADAKIGQLIDRIEVESDQRADKLIGLCRLFNLDGEADKVAKKYANHIAETSERYGTALIYYARAHDIKKVKDVLALLISYCLVQSTAFPPFENLDPHLSSLMTKPRESLLWLAKIDTSAAEILSINMSGYATLRKFYDIRDEAKQGRALSVPRMKSAATALLAVISSASSSIQGGIYDPESDAVVPFEVILVLLGEAMPFVDTRSRYLSLQHIMILLRAIEDVQTVHPQIRAQCDECLKSALASGFGTARGADPQAMLKKSVSALTGSSGFSIIGESIENESLGREEQWGREDISRGWDWRAGLRANDGGDQVIGMLRLGLAKEVSRAWLDGEEFK